MITLGIPKVQRIENMISWSPTTAITPYFTDSINSKTMRCACPFFDQSRKTHALSSSSTTIDEHCGVLVNQYCALLCFAPTFDSTLPIPFAPVHPREQCSTVDVFLSWHDTTRPESRVNTVSPLLLVRGSLYYRICSHFLLVWY